MQLLLGLMLALSGGIAGIYVSVWIHDHRIVDLSAAQYAAMHQMRDKTFRKVMPALSLTSLGLMLVCTALGLAAGTPRLLGAAGALLMIIDIAVAVTRQVPLNLAVQSWAGSAIPADWSVIRDRWARQHNVRASLALVAFACLLAAVLLTVAC